MTTLEQALSYIRRGFSVVPLVPATKRPAVPLAPYLSGEARMIEDKARAYWTEHPDHGVGIVTGGPSGLVIIDVDPRNGGDIQAVVRRFGDADLLTARTGGGGLHIYCRHPGGRVSCGKTSMPGVDRKGDGGYVVAPPSLHPDGGSYEWNTPDGQLVDVPDWALERATHESESEPSEPWIADALANPEGVLPGTQEETLTKLAWWCARHMPEDIAHALLVSWIARLPLGKPYEPWLERHVEERLTSAYANREPDPGRVTGIVDDLTPEQRAVQPGRRVVPTLEALREKVRTAPEFATQAAADASKIGWLVEDFVAPGCWTEVIGVMKEGKSTLVCGMLHELLSGGEFLDRPCRQTNVLYLTEQVGLSFLKTLERGALTDQPNLYVLTAAELFGLDWQTTASLAIDLALELDCGVIVVDTLARLAGLEDEDKADAVAVLNPFLKARANGIATIFVRHSRKAGGAINVAGRGNGAITGDMDVCLYITAPQGVGADYRKLEGVSRLSDTIEIHLEYTGGTYVVGEAPRAKAERAKMEPILEAIMAVHPKPITLAELREALGTDGEKKSTVHRRLSRLVEQDRLIKDGDTYRLNPSHGKSTGLVDDLKGDDDARAA